KHILLVDDVLTTGSTLISCGSELAKASNVRISICTLAYAGELVDSINKK
ncbi:MAG: ComF family protein, partial [Bacteroidaceae bacterium]|nr:ComF family protein [Bacteroidaceae bacterium]